MRGNGKKNPGQTLEFVFCSSNRAGNETPHNGQCAGRQAEDKRRLSVKKYTQYYTWTKFVAPQLQKETKKEKKNSLKKCETDMLNASVFKFHDHHIGGGKHFII